MTTISNAQAKVLDRIEKVLDQPLTVSGVGIEVANLAHALCRLEDSKR